VRRARRELDLSLWAYVIMPEHVHLLFCPRQAKYEVSRVRTALKAPVARKALRFLKRRAPEFLEKLRDAQPNGEVHYRFWQRGGGYDRNEGRDLVYLWPEKNWHEPPVVLRLIERRDGKKKMFLVTNVLDKKSLSDESAAVFYEMRWGVEVFYRSLKQTLRKRKMLSHSPTAAKCELTWAMFGMWLLGLMSVAGILARGADPLSWSAALARNRVRRSMRSALTGRRQDRGLAHDLARTTKDTYHRLGSKKARDWPHKKKEKPPGNPIIQVANAEQRRAMQRLKAKQAAA